MRNDFLSLPKIPVSLPEWPALDGKVFARHIMAKPWEDRRLAEKDKTAVGEFSLWMVVQSICDVDGNRYFDDADVTEFDTVSRVLVERMLAAVVKMNRLDDDEGTIEKNS